MSFAIIVSNNKSIAGAALRLGAKKVFAFHVAGNNVVCNAELHTK